ncbi:hypothetical protein [Marinicellulosiphila megalodicopiae]|uniref:hypothetical protein n=1 Tax=Marinicellulosiphila megalodicopiae TaxID=2724896 RepID=UPI003BB2026C
MFQSVYRFVLNHPKKFLLLSGWLLLSADIEFFDGYAKVNIQSEPFYVSKDYLGVAIDAAMLTDGQWWADSNSPPRPLNMDNNELIKWAKLLSPKWLRLGGTEADKLWLADSEAEASNPTFESTLTKQQLNAFLNFADTIQARPFITASTGPLTRHLDEWQPFQFTRLLSWLPKNYNGHIEFGNEMGAHWLMFSFSDQIGFEQYGAEYHQAKQLMQNYPNVKLAGPANAFWPKIGEPLKQILGSSKSFLQQDKKPDIFTWHYYPTQSDRCGINIKETDWDHLLDDETFEEFSRQSTKVASWITDYSDETILWLGETGASQCGGTEKLTDRFGSSLWWLAHLGTAAKTGNQTIIRQSLIGGDYALLRYNGHYSPTPDYWASVLWQKLMGAKGFNVKMTGAEEQIQSFAHCHPTKSNTLTLLLVNLKNKDIQIELDHSDNMMVLSVDSLSIKSSFTFVQSQLAETLNWQDIYKFGWIEIYSTTLLKGHSYQFIEMNDSIRCG